MAVREVTYPYHRLTWQFAGSPEQFVIGRYEAIKLVESLIKGLGVNKIELLALEYTSARLPAPGAESTEPVDLAGKTRQGGRHAAPRTTET